MLLCCAGPSSTGHKILAGGVDRRNVGAVRVKKVKALEALDRQRIEHIADHRHHGAGPQSHRAGKAQVELGRAQVQGGGQQPVPPLGGALRNGLRQQGVGADRADRAMLLGRAGGNDDASAALQILQHLRPAGMGQSHGLQ